MQFVCDCSLERVSCLPTVCVREKEMSKIEELERRIEELERRERNHFIPNMPDPPKGCPSCGKFPPMVCNSTACPMRITF